ncbi:MAG: hypothetical protein KatS3mg115_1820 [Candidatus Poribacteria bacterium]|nr:MAG: hypothetical protein KatS3mg115_1820 [Candidatus Poribacteria bacterium]
MVAQCLRYQPKHLAVKRAIESGELGTLYAADSSAMQNLRAIRPPGDWLFDGRIAGGGVIISVSVHVLDLLRYFVGEVQRVSAECRVRRPEFIHGAEDYAGSRRWCLRTAPLAVTLPPTPAIGCPGEPASSCLGKGEPFRTPPSLPDQRAG